MTNERGQSATETMIMMLFLLMMLFTTVHLGIFAITKYMVNLAAFSAARTAMVGGNEQQAAEQVMSNLQWWKNPDAHKPVLRDRALNLSGRGRNGILVTSSVPFTWPYFLRAKPEGTRVVGFSPMAARPPRNEQPQGDNAEP